MNCARGLGYYKDALALAAVAAAAADPRARRPEPKRRPCTKLEVGLGMADFLCLLWVGCIAAFSGSDKSQDYTIKLMGEFGMSSSKTGVVRVIGRFCTA